MKSQLQTLSDELRTTEVNIQEGRAEIELMHSSLNNLQAKITLQEGLLRERVQYVDNLIGRRERLLAQVSEVARNAG